jgi:hypothetical protein
MMMNDDDGGYGGDHGDDGGHMAQCLPSRQQQLVLGISDSSSQFSLPHQCLPMTDDLRQFLFCTFSTVAFCIQLSCASSVVAPIRVDSGNLTECVAIGNVLDRVNQSRFRPIWLVPAVSRMFQNA